MSIETLIAELNTNLKLVAEKLENVITSAGSAPATKPEDGEEKPKRTRKSKATETAEASSDDTSGDEDEGNGIDREKVGAEAKAWVFEFKANEADPETKARGEAFKAALGKLGATKTADVKEEDLPRVVKWLTTQKTKGRLTGELKVEEADEGDEDDI